ncbi:uncharacterized protein A4U43_C10F12370 [Asparagus officinalis]|uniref:Uncharacterized protein n=1 Tax=Asparagus officinalis TaxID=4686 RepID=A0A5P1E2A2_ASPOF|nr:uncharacterized protein A4U43_C10F12370 [Asparagus officinalis]
MYCPWDYPLVTFGYPMQTSSAKSLSNFASQNVEIEEEVFERQMENKTILIDDKLVKAQIWDTAAQERYRSITTAYYRGALGALIIYNITNPDTFECVPRWLDQLRAYADPSTVIMLVGNKYNLELHCAVSVKSGKDIAEKERLLFLETSASDATNVEKAFLIVLERIYQTVSRKTLQGSEEPPPLVIKSSLQGMKLDVKENQQRYGCCTQ